MKVHLLAIAVGFLVAAFPDEVHPESADPPFTVRLRHRQFVPKTGIEAELREALKNLTEPPLHGIAQLYRTPSANDRLALQQAGVKLRQNLNNTVYWADFSLTADVDSVTNVIRWAGLLKPEDRVEQSLWEGKIEAWARKPDGKLRLLAGFHDTASTNTVNHVLSRHASSFRFFGMSGQWAIEIVPQKLKALAAEPSIYWLRQGPTEFRPLDSGLRHVKE